MNKSKDTPDEQEPRRHPQGSEAVTIAFTAPKKLAQRINGIRVMDGPSRSLIIAKLIEDGFKYREQKGQK